MSSSDDPLKTTTEDLQKSTEVKPDTTDGTGTEPVKHESEAVKKVLEDLLEDEDNG